MGRGVAIGWLAGALLWAAPASAELELVSARELTPRLTELTLRTDALASETQVRVLLPSGYAGGRRRYPVLYLLHGGADDYRSWTDKGEAERLTEGLPLIVVMPNAGQGGWYTDWFNNGAGGPPSWERYHVQQLIPWIDRRYRTVAQRGGRAIAGLSMGGFGAMSYAARHPGLFVAAASFSGAVDTNTPELVAPTVIDSISMLDGGGPGALWGPRASEEVRWRGHNPWDLAENLRGLSLTVRTGNGQAGGPYGGGPADPLEIAVHDMGVSFHERLEALGIPHVWDDYGAGGHTWPYWVRGLGQTLPSITESFAHPPRRPSPFAFTAVEPSYGAHGWQVRLDRPVLEFSRIGNAGRRGFTLGGSGSAVVRTARLFRPGRSYSLVLRGDFGVQRRRRRAGRLGRLRVRVPLGAANTTQQYTPAADAVGTRVYETRVRIARVPR